LGGCSVINQFDDVKAGPAGAGGAPTAGSGGSSPDGGSTGGNGGSATGGSATAGSGGTSDAGPDATVRLLNCRFVIGSATGGHRKLDDFSQIPNASERVLADKFFMMPTGNGTSVRILTQLRGQQNTYSEYFASDTMTGFQPQPIVSNGRLLDAHKLNVSTSGALIIETTSPTMVEGPRFLLHTFDDANVGAQPTIAAITNPGALGTSGSIEGIFSPDPMGTFTVAASFSATGTVFQAAVGIVRQPSQPIQLIPLFQDADSNVVRPSSVVRVAGGSSYAFYGETFRGQREYEIKSDGTVGPMRALTGTASVLLANMSLSGKLDVMMGDVNTTALTLKLLVGQFDLSQAMTFDVTQLVTAKEASSISEVPVGALSGFVGDILLFGGPTGLSRKELSILFIDAMGRVRAEQKLADTPGEVANGVVFPRGTNTGVTGNYHIAWSETLLDPAGQKYDTVWYDQLECL